ncbi:MAG: AsmA family protein, partial [Candidatus Rokubacteria bacterium]|nr:AsmA family protein [Candidatus Rokubacteria bacterium]
MKWVLIGIGVLLLLAVAFVIAVPYLVDAAGVQAAIAHSASQALGRPVSFASLSLAALPLPALRLTDLRVAEDPKFGTTPFLTVGEGRLGLRVWPLVRGRLEAAELVLDGPRVGLIQEPGGRWNIQSLGARPAGAPTAVKEAGVPSGGGLFPAVSRIRVAGGTLSYEARKKDGVPITYRLETLNFAASTAGPAAPVNFHGESRLTPGGLRLKITDGSLIPEAGRPLAESALKADVELSAEDIAPLLRAFLGPARELGGPVRGKLALSGTPSRLAVQGELEFSRLRVSEHRATCAEPKTRSLTLESVRLPLTYSPFRLTSQPFSARLGPGTATLALTLD